MCLSGVVADVESSSFVHSVVRSFVRSYVHSVGRSVGRSTGGLFVRSLSSHTRSCTCCFNIFAINCFFNAHMMKAALEYCSSINRSTENCWRRVRNVLTVFKLFGGAEF